MQREPVRASAITVKRTNVVSVLAVCAMLMLLLAIWCALLAPKASASGLTEPQIQAVLGLLTSFNVDQATVSNVNAILHGTVPANTNTSPVALSLTRTLSLGSEGNDVSQLQQFLATSPSIYPEGKVTGYFGALTEAAVKRFQIKYSIVSSGTAATTGLASWGRAPGRLFWRLLPSNRPILLFLILPLLLVLPLRLHR
jgi:hypothetical protein